MNISYGWIFSKMNVFPGWIFFRIWYFLYWKFLGVNIFRVNIFRGEYFSDVNIFQRLFLLGVNIWGWIFFLGASLMLATPDWWPSFLLLSSCFPVLLLPAIFFLVYWLFQYHVRHQIVTLHCGRRYCGHGHGRLGQVWILFQLNIC